MAQGVASFDLLSQRLSLCCFILRQRQESSIGALSIELDVQRKDRLAQLHRDLEKEHSAALDAERSLATKKLEETVHRETQDAIARLDAERARLRAEFQAVQTEASLNAEARLSEEHTEQLQALQVELEEQNQEVVFFSALPILLRVP